MRVISNSSFSFAKKNDLTIKSNFYVLCINCRGLFSTTLCLLSPTCLWPYLPHPETQYVCIRAGQAVPGAGRVIHRARGCGVKVCAWEPRWSLLTLSLEKLGSFLHPDIKKATWPGSPGALWPGTRWLPCGPLCLWSSVYLTAKCSFLNYRDCSEG